jgi:hypothetical protein
MRGGIITPQKDLCDALYKKTLKYGALDKPYLIAVADGKDQLFNKDSINSALTEAVFGDEIVQFKGGTAHISHAKNGFWHGPNGPRNQHVSGVLLLPETGLWKLREAVSAPWRAKPRRSARPQERQLHEWRLDRRGDRRAAVAAVAGPSLRAKGIA